MAAPQYMDKLELSFDPSKISGYYVYILAHDDVPFYVGLGKNSRWRQHFHNTPFKEGRNSYRYRKIRKLLGSEDEKIQVHIAAHRLSVEEAQSLEMKLIADYGRKRDGGTLTNMSIGGESGANGREHTEEFKEKRSLESRGQNSLVTEDLVYKAKALHHYCGLNAKALTELPEFSGIKISTIHGWFSKANPNYNYVAPHLKSEKSIWNEKREECKSLFLKGWGCPQISDILGLEPSFVRNSCKELR